MSSSSQWRCPCGWTHRPSVFIVMCGMYLLPGLSRLLAEREEEVSEVRRDLDSVRQASSDLEAQLHAANREIEMLVSESCDSLTRLLCMSCDCHMTYCKLNECIMSLSYEKHCINVTVT